MLIGEEEELVVTCSYTAGAEQGVKVNLRDDVVCEEDKPGQDHPALHIAASCS